MQYQELARRTAFDLKMLGQSLLDVRAGLASKLAAVAGLACMFMPFDLIPNRILVVGYLDEAAYATLGLIAAFLGQTHHRCCQPQSRKVAVYL